MPVIHVVGNVLLLGFFTAVAVAAARRGGWVPWAGVVAGAAVFLAAFVMRGRPDLLVMMVPWRHVYFYSHLFPFAAALAIPSVLGFVKDRQHRLRVRVLLAVLATLTMVDYRYFFGELAPSRGTVIDDAGVCRQSEPDLCAAAAGVTLLRLNGIDTTEAQIAQDACTRAGRGTHDLGLYRGLCLAVAEQPGVQIRYRRVSVEELIRAGRPAIVTAGIPKIPESPLQRELSDKYQWAPGVWHDVVFFGTVEGDAAHIGIGDPDFGYEEWPREHFEALFQGFAMWVE